MLEELMGTFLAEAQELCERGTQDLLTLERATRGGEGLAKAYEGLKRSLHTLKGSSATLELADVAAIAHAMEEALAPVAGALLPVPAPVADQLLTAFDEILSRVKAHAGGRAGTLVSAAELVNRLRAVGAGGVVPSPSAPAAPEAEAAPDRADALVSRERADWRIGANDVTLLLREVERLREVHLRLEERHRDLAKGLVLLDAVPPAPEVSRARAAFLAVGHALRGEAEEFAEIVGSVEDRIRVIGAAPVQSFLEPLHRLVRDVCRKTGKEARLSVVGGEVSLDRRIVEKVKSPLVHLLRNAIDHGIETPDTRVSRGKFREGMVTLRVEPQGNLVFIEVSDDGQGIDEQRVRAIAEERGICSAEQLARMSSSELQDLVFRPGFSTRAVATELSGRGVGLDVVRTEVLAIKGQIEVQSVPGAGTRFVLSIPAEFGSSPTMVVRCGETQVGIAMVAIESVTLAREKDIRVDSGGMTLLHHEDLLPLRDLGALLGLRQPDVPGAGQPILILSAQRERIALAVDQVIGYRELVIRALPRELAGMPAYQGAAALARGELLPVLRPDWAVGSAQRASVDAGVVGRRALVVDDSLTARALHRTILEAGGYVVHTLSSGQQALQQIRRSRYEVVVCDLAMEGMDGLAFTAALRARPEGRNLAVLLVSAHDEEASHRRALEAGADGFVSKRDCARGRLLAEVSAILSRKAKRE